ncbi:hypothetical protein [Bradyrhizobium sp. th.b2]|uniref:hypothetical protein n=1 Tax=Bradyrhizobium sp. th-b2 TaxID=172088 RepID=UPI0004190D4B|nr:hypothetical protein [Bradyrhizobium sp. th.b2]
MVDDVLRMRATVVSEQALANIRAIGREIGLVGQRGAPGIKTINTEFARLGATVKTVGRELTSAIPALGGVGLGAAGVGIAIGAMTRTMGDAAKRAVELKHASRELGMSERDLRAWQTTAEKAGVSAESMMSGIEGFKKTMDGLKYNIGGTRDELYAMGAGPLVARLQAIRDPAEKLREIFRFKDTLLTQPDGQFKAKRLFDMLELGGDKAKLSLEDYNATLSKTRERTKEETEAAEKYHKALVDLGAKWNDLIIKGGVQLFPKLTEAIKYLETISGWLDRFEEFNRGPTGKGTLLGKILPGYDGPSTNPSQSPRSGYRPPASDVPAGDAFKKFLNPGNPRAGGYKRTSFGDSVGGFGASDGLSEFSHAVKDGVFAALVEFRSYVQGGAAGTGMMNASLSGGGGGASGFRSGGGYSVVPEGAGVPGSPTANLSPGSGGAQGSDSSGGGAVPRAMGRLPGGARGTGISKGGDGPAGPAGDQQADTADTSKTGNAFLQSQRARIKGELDADPELRKRFAAIIQTENPGAGTAVAESAMNRAAMTGRSLRSIISGGPKSFYGPARRGQIEPTMRNMTAKTFGERSRQIDEALRGSNIIRGHTDQGSAGDPNYIKGGVGVNVNRERFNDWGGHRGVEYSREWRLQQQRQVNAAAAARPGGDVWGGGARPFSRIDSAVDTSATGGMRAEGSVNVAITSNGTAATARTKTDGDLWQKSTVENYRQMQPTNVPAGRIAEGHAAFE